MILRGKKVLVTGAGGFLGSYVLEELGKQLPGKIIAPTHKEADFRKRATCEKYVRDVDVVIHLAAQIGGIGFINEKPGEIFYNNAIMGIELMEASRKAKVEKMAVVGTVCEYPAFTPTPFKESAIWDGYPEEITAPYGWAKKILIVQAMAYRKQYGFNCVHVLPVNLYGPRDNFDERQSHVIPALIKRFVGAKQSGASEVVVWGSGRATREFLYAQDAAKGILAAVKKHEQIEPINLGTGVETPIKKLVEIIAETVGFTGKITWDKTKPDGQLRRKLNTRRAEQLLGFKAKVGLREGLKKTVTWYKKQL